jgi:anti-sigma factor RsiW
MSFVPDDDGHVRAALGLYLLGALNDDEQATVERHLARCPSCLDEYDRHGEILSYLAHLDENDADDLSDLSEPLPVPRDPAGQA